MLSIETALALSIVLAVSNSTNPSENQYDQKDYVGWLISFIATIPPTIGLFFTAKAFRNDSNSRFLQTFREFDTDIWALLNSDDRKADFEFDNGKLIHNVKSIWTIKYLNFVEKLAFLFVTGRIPNDMILYFKSSFQYARYFIEKVQEFNIPDYDNIMKVCINNKWEGYNFEAELPRRPAVETSNSNISFNLKIGILISLSIVVLLVAYLLYAI